MDARFRKRTCPLTFHQLLVSFILNGGNMQPPLIKISACSCSFRGEIGLK